MTKLQYYRKVARKMKAYLEDEYGYEVKVNVIEKSPPRVVLSLSTEIDGIVWPLLKAIIYLDTEKIDFVPEEEEPIADYLVRVFGLSDTEADIEVVDMIHQAIAAVEEAWRESVEY